MYSFPELIREIRNKADMTQSEFAEFLDVSPVLITMVETGQKEVSKRLIVKLADRMNVHPSSITPFLFSDRNIKNVDHSKIENFFISWGEKMQNLLINDRAKRLKKNAK